MNVVMQRVKTEERSAAPEEPWRCYGTDRHHAVHPSGLLELRPLRPFTASFRFFRIYGNFAAVSPLLLLRPHVRSCGG